VRSVVVVAVVVAVVVFLDLRGSVVVVTAASVITAVLFSLAKMKTELIQSFVFFEVEVKFRVMCANNVITAVSSKGTPL